MSLQTPRTRAWSKITTASTDRIAKRKSQLYRTLSKHNCPVPECGTIEEENGDTFSDQGFTETEELEQSNTYDEKAFTEALKEINSELESLRSLYNSQWFTDMRRSLDKNRSKEQAADVETHRSTVTTEQFPRKTPSTNDLNVSQYRKNPSEMQNTTALMPTALARQQQYPFKKEVNAPNRGRKILPPHDEKQIVAGRELNKKAVEIPDKIAEDVTSGAVNHSPTSEILSTINMISKLRQEENMGKTLPTDTQNKFSSTDNKVLYNNFTQMLCEVDKITDELTELQRFKDAIYAMNEEFENTETEASKISATLMPPQSHFPHNSPKVQTVLQRSSEKRSPILSYSSTKINTVLQETDRTVNKIKMPHSEMLYNTEISQKFINTQADKQRKSNTDLLNRREIKMPHSEMLYNIQIPQKFINTQADKQRESKTDLLNRRKIEEKKKGTMNHNLQSTKQKLVVHSLPDNKHRIPQGYSEKALPLEVNPLKVHKSAQPVSKSSATNKMSKKSSPKTSKPVAPKRTIK